MAVHWCTETHITALIPYVPAGLEAWVHVAPPSRVVTTTDPPVTDPVEPTAMQSSLAGHEIPLSWGGADSIRPWAFHVTPPFAVAAITVREVAVDAGPIPPTAQQCWASAQDTAVRSPRPVGPGWPTTAAFFSS
jgi:hypothetical protein